MGIISEMVANKLGKLSTKFRRCDRSRAVETRQVEIKNCVTTSERCVTREDV